ncbi:MAG: hypothetical protein JWQ09_2932, partial [Segetibacter sp.]|nr:hypothetical protein [Segetibacter sp.]
MFPLFFKCLTNITETVDTMRYVPKLIPDQYKVFPEYFKGNIYSTTVRNKLLVVVSLIIAIIFFVIALVSIIHPLLALLFGLTGFIILPSGQQWLEQKLRFQMTFKIKLVTVAALLIVSAPLIAHYGKIDAQEAYELQVKKDHDEKERIAAEQKEHQRKDSINYYIQTAITFEKIAKFEEALS